AVAVTVALGFAVASPSAALEDQASFSKRVAKYATTDPDKPKGLCWCKDGFGGAGEGEAGYVAQQVTAGPVLVACQIPAYDASGKFPPILVQCAVEWDMLGK